MSVSDPKVDDREPTAANAVAEDSNFAIPDRLQVPAASLPLPSYRTITDRELTLVQICCDFVCACIALPLALLLLTRLSAVPVNSSAELMTNLQIDALFPWRS